MVRRYSSVLAAFCLALFAAAAPAQAQTTGISGRVTNGSASPAPNGGQAPGAGLQFVNVFAYQGSNTFTSASASTDSSGNYTLTGLTGGQSYFVVTANFNGLVDQIFKTGGNVSCGGCGPSTVGSAGAVAVTGGGVTPNIDFALTAGARISGRVIDAATTSPLAGVNVNIFLKSNAFFAGSFGQTDSAGNFGLTGGSALPPGTYVALTNNSQSYIDRIYDGLTCPGGQCNLATGTSIVIASTASVTGINFALPKGGSVSGAVTSSGGPVSGASVTIYNSAGNSVAFANTNSSGVYATSGLLDGTYFAKAQSFSTSPSFVPQLFNGIPCLGCSVTSGTGIAVATPTVSTANFALQQAGAITGTIRDASNVPINNAFAQVYTTSGSFVGGSPSTSTNGFYTIGGLATGSYIVRAFGPNGGVFISRVYTTGGGFDCSNCDVSAGSPVGVTAGATSSPFDFSLTTGGSIGGTVFDNGTGSPIANLNVALWNASGSQLTSTQTNGAGTFTFGGLLSGTYYVKTNSSSSANFIPEIWAGGGAGVHVTCSFCSVNIGTAISVTAGTQVTGKDFRLLVGRSIGGIVTNAAGTPLSGISVNVFDANNANSTTNNGSIAGFSTSGSGTYTIAGLAPGIYFVKTSATGGFLDEVYNDIACLNCSAYGGTPIDLTSVSRTDINFSLAAGGRISGKIMDPTGAPLASSNNAFVGAQIYSATGFFITSASTAADGTFLTGAGLPPGTYYVASQNPFGYINSLWNGISCFSCPVTSGTPITVTAGATTSGINLTLAAGASIKGTVTSSASGNPPIANAFVQVYSSSTGLFLTSSSTNSLGVYTVGGLSTGSYFVRTSNGLGFIDQLFGGGACLGCDVTTGQAVPATIGNTTTGINFTLVAGGTISGTVTDTASTPNPLSGIFVQAYNSAGLFVSSVSTQANGTYALKGLAPGPYFVRTSNSLGYINLLKGSSLPDIICGSCTITAGAPINVTGTFTTGPVNFALAQGSILKGRVTTTDATPVGIAGVSVSVVTATGSTVSSSGTDGSGNYMITGIVPGTYFLKTFNSLGFIDQVFKGIECLSCSVSAGTPVTLVLGTTTTLGPADDFKLPAGGRIRGKVTDNATPPNPLSGVTVEVYRAGGSFATQATTTAQGTYVSNIGLPPGDYIVRTRNSLGYVDKLYENITCLNCSVLTGKLVTLTGTAAIALDSDGNAGVVASAANIDFSLAIGGGISGNVKAADSTPLQNVFVQIYTDAGSFVTSTSTNGLGNYVLKGVPNGTYFARTSNSVGYIDQLWQSIACSNCLASSGKPISVTAGGVTPAIDFTLTLGGRVSGTVTAAAGGAPIGNVSISVFNLAGSQVASGFTSTAGTYVTGGLPAGDYYVKTFNSIGFVNQLHSGIVCQSCTVTGGTKITVALGAATTVNFSLATGGSISGTVTNAVGGAALANLNVAVYTSTGLFFSSVNTNAVGVYTISGLPTGPYTVRTSNSAGFIDKLYEDLDCLSCSVTTGKPVAVTAGAAVTGINFSLKPGGLVSGKVTDAVSGSPLAGIGVSLYNSANFFVSNATSDTLGNYVMRSGVPAGTYYARTNNNLGFINVTYPNSACLNCPITVGTPITVALGQTTPNINFALALGGRVTGTITDSAGLPLSGVSVTLFLADGTSVGGSGTNSLGFYSTQGLPAGTYFLKTNNGLGYVNRLYEAIDCVRCSVATGKPITVTAGLITPNINLALSLGGRVSGTITDAATGLPLSGASVTIFDSGGFNVSGATANAAGEFITFNGLTSGTYYARTFNNAGYVNKLYDTYVCLGCNPTVGKPITVTVGATSTGINFALNAGGRIGGMVTTGGAGVANAFVNIFSSGGTFLTGVTTGSGGQYITGDGLPPGSYYLVTSNNSGLVDQLYDANSCGFSCAVTSGKAVVVTASATTQDINFSLVQGGRISGRVTDKATGAPIANLDVDVFNSSGAEITNGRTDGLGNYTTFGGVPTGTYFVGVFGATKGSAYITKAYNDVTCTGCTTPVGVGNGVAVTAGSTTPGIDFALDAGEAVSGTITDAATNQPIAGARVALFNDKGVFVGEGRSDDSGGYTITSGVPAGTYFARTFNGLGYVDRVYDTNVCLGCDVTRGTPIVVDGIGITGGKDFKLTAGGRINGRVTAAADGSPVSGSKIRIFNTAGTFIGQVFTNGNGDYFSFGLPPGSYFLRTANTSGLIDKLYLSAPCTPCTLSQGTAVPVVTAGLKSGIDFALSAGGLISGFVKDQATGSPVQGVTVSVYRASDGVLVATTDPTDSNGYYQISLPTGTYQVEPNPISGFRPALAALKGPAARATVVVDTGTETTGVGFNLVSCAPLTVNPASLPLGAQGQLYSTTLTATGGTAPFTFSISDGNPNTGLALAASGLLAGTPVFAGTGNFTVAAMDANQCAGTRVFALTACSFFLSSNSLSTTASAGAGTVDLTASATDCPWTVTTAASFITLTSAVNGTGSATVTFSFAFNSSGAARSGVILVGGQAFTLTQAASSSGPAFGQVDTPAPGATGINGSLAVTGWALDDVEVKRIQVSRDPVAGEGTTDVYLGDATLVDGARPDVAAVNPSLPFNTRAGWGYLLLTNMLPNQGNGTFTLHMDAIDAEGSVTRLGNRTFTSDNANSITPFGAIDTPPQGGTVSGSMANFGWVLSPGARRADPPGGGTVQAIIDGVFQTSGPGQWTSRSDLSSLFPAANFAGVSNALGVVVYDTTTLANGVHTIAWIVTDNGGQATGVGSRYFTVNNVQASQRFAPTLTSMRASAVSGGAASGPAVSARVGFDRTAPALELMPDPTGGRLVAVGQLGLVDLRFGQVCGAVSAVQVVDGARVAMPVGATLDPSGAFHWMPGPAFLGTYTFEFSVPSCGGGATKLPVTVAVVPGR